MPEITFMTSVGVCRITACPPFSMTWHLSNFILFKLIGHHADPMLVNQELGVL